jgi:hypothetical protein
MPDLDIDPLATAFVTFREEAPIEMIAPGSAAAHRSVARRRVGTTVVLAAVVVIMSALAYVQLQTGHAPTQPATIVVTRTPTNLAEAAYIAMGGYIDTEDQPQVLGAGPQAIGNSIDQPYVIPLADHALGAYELLGLCMGGGTVHESVYRHVTSDTPIGSTVGPSIGSLTVPCNGKLVHTIVTVPAPKVPTIWLSVSGDAQAQNSAGLAYAFADLFLTTEQMDLLAHDELSIVTGSAQLRPGYMDASGPLDGVRHDSDSDFGGPGGVAAGLYAMDFACVGGGRVDVTWTIGGTSSNASIPCDEAAHAVRINATAAGAMTVETKPSLAALDRAGYAFLVQAG